MSGTASSRAARVIVGLVGGLALTLAGCGGAAGPAGPGGSSPTATVPATAVPGTAVPGTAVPGGLPAWWTPVPPAGRAMFGVHPDWETDAPARFVARTGLHPAVFGDFATFPVTAEDASRIQATAALVHAQGAALFLTLEPQQGLASVTPAAAAEAARVLAAVNASGVPVYLRFAHEMNGSWYAWGQQPQAYVAAFRTLADAVHATAKQTFLVWAPNYGSGYPFPAGTYAAAPGSADYARLDTNHDGTLTAADDMYAPFYPGDDAADWVGLTLYFFGLAYPWSENELPDAGRFAAQLGGTYRSRYGDETALPDFYTAYAVRRDKPMVLAETAAWFNTQRHDGAPQAAVETAWMDQVFSAAVRSRFPRLAMVNWFEHAKTEAEAHGVVDWRVTADPALLARLREHLASGLYVTAGAPS